MRNDLRLALRALSRNLGYTVVIVVALALGIGANTAIFSLFDQVVLRLLPVQNPEKLVLFHSPGRPEGWASSESSHTVYSLPIYREFAQSGLFKDVIARSSAPVSLAHGGLIERTRAELVSGSFFPALGVQAFRGRLFTAADDQTEGGHPVTVLSHGFWQRRFGADEAILNQTITVNAQAISVVGITPPNFHGVMSGRSPDLYIPLAMWREMRPEFNDGQTPEGFLHWLNILARLKPGMTRERSQAAVAPLYRAQLEAEAAEYTSRIRDREEHASRRLELQPAIQGIATLQERLETPLRLLLAMAAVVLVVACVNVAGLMLSRSVARSRETAIRLALGAARWRIIRQLLTESLCLAVLGTAAGLAVAIGTLRLLFTMPPADQWTGVAQTLDARVLAYSLALSLLTALLCGMAPALEAWRVSFTRSLKQQSGAGECPRATIFRKTIVVAQVALSMLLLVGAGLFARSLYNLRTFDPGFRTANLLTFSIDPALNGYSLERSRRLQEDLLARLGQMPGVETAATSEIQVLTNSNMGGNITVEDYQPAPDEYVGCSYNAVSPRYFQTMGMPLLQGREFNDFDRADSAKVAIVNEAFEKRYFGDQSAVGKRFRFGAGNGQLDIEIVGVVGNQRNTNLRQQTNLFAYLPQSQRERLTTTTFYLRTELPESALGPQIRQLAREFDPALPVYAMQTMEVVLENSIALDRVVATLAVAFAALATLLAVVGLFGLISYTVIQRRREIGIRLALGANRQNVVRLFMGQAFRYVAIGLAAGALAAAAASRYIESQLFGVTAQDPAIFLAAAVLLAAAGLLSAFVPARRASGLHPTDVLRCE
jgi:predicted permease